MLVNNNLTVDIQKNRFEIIIVIEINLSGFKH